MTETVRYRIEIDVNYDRGATIPLAKQEFPGDNSVEGFLAAAISERIDAVDPCCFPNDSNEPDFIILNVEVMDNS